MVIFCAHTPTVGQILRTCRVARLALGAVALLFVAALSVAIRPTERLEPEIFREQPLSVDATGKAASLLSADDLCVLVNRVRPSWERPRVAALIHCLRLWGPDAEMTLPCPPGSRASGAAASASLGRPSKAMPRAAISWDVTRVLCDDNAFQGAFGRGPPFVMWQRDGLATRQALDDRAAAHVDDLLAAAAEAGLPLSTPMHAGSRAGTLRDLLRGAITRFDIDQELEFTSVALAAYLPPAKSWTNRRGQTFTFDEVAHELLGPSTPKQACHGTHVPYALVFLLRVDEREAILAPETRQTVIARLRRISGDLESRQDETGAWVPDRIQRDPLDEGQDLAMFRVTGHHLEWIALAPPDVRPTAGAVERAARWLYKAILQQPAAYAYFGAGYNDNTHAARALLLLHHRAPAEFRQATSKGAVSLARGNRGKTSVLPNESAGSWY